MVKIPVRKVQQIAYRERRYCTPQIKTTQQKLKGTTLGLNRVNQPSMEPMLPVLSEGDAFLARLVADESKLKQEQEKPHPISYSTTVLYYSNLVLFLWTVSSALVRDA